MLATTTMMAIFATLLTAPQQPQTSNITFIYPAQQGVKAVDVVGQFNNWVRGANPLAFNVTKNEWIATFRIPVGVYQYLFVLNHSKWVRDPNAPIAPDANGNKNSSLIVAPEYYLLKPGATGDGFISTQAISHKPDRLDTCRVDNNCAWVSITTRANDIQFISVRIVGSSKNYPAKITHADPLYDTWKATIPFDKNGLTKYYFHIQDGSEIIDYGRNGVQPLNKSLPFVQAINDYPLPKEPKWVKNAIIYQIFPDRFWDGDRSIDPKGVKPWGTLPTPQTWQIRLGGDLQGIIDKLPYLEHLGINCIYLNPIFESLSNHGYDTVDYYHVDHRFGSNEVLRQLVEKCHQAGIRVILDGVFNHTSPDFFAFKDILKNQEKSKYLHWYHISKFPVIVKEGQTAYETFAGVPTMAKLNQDNPATAKYFCGVGAYWINYAHIDGWRLDVGDGISHSFWRKFRKSVKSADPNAYIVGEEWGDAHTYLQGNEHDAVMNYRWRAAVLDYFVNHLTTAQQFIRKLNVIRTDYPRACFLNEFNLIGSHDTERIRTLCKDSNDQEAQVIAFQFLYPGVPTIYYGDEIGMDGGHDPDDRRPMIWDPSQWNGTISSIYRLLIQLRKSNSVLTHGTACQLKAEDGGIILHRSYKGQSIEGVFAGKKSMSINSNGLVLFISRGLVVGNHITLQPNGICVIEVR